MEVQLSNFVRQFAVQLSSYSVFLESKESSNHKTFQLKYRLMPDIVDHLSFSEYINDLWRFYN